jgi:hypothetical protein
MATLSSRAPEAECLWSDGLAARRRNAKETDYGKRMSSDAVAVGPSSEQTR